MPIFFATAAKGTEPALRDELREVGLLVRADRGGVHFEGTEEDGMRACLWSRVAQRVLVQRAQFEARTEDELYEGIRAMTWGDVLTPRHTLAVRASCKSSRLTHTQFISQLTKDAIVDQLRERGGARPSVNREDPDVGISVHLVDDYATVYLDLAGAPLHQRGYRTRIGAAPLKETLAAALVRLSGWDRKTPFVDPMCGSGTIAIEADLWARDIAPGLLHESFGFQRWASFDDTKRTRWRALCDMAKARMRKSGPVVRGSDLDSEAIRSAEANGKDAGANVAWSVADFATVDMANTFVVTNPPYDARLAASDGFYKGMAKVFRAAKGSTVTLLSGAPAMEKAMGKKPEKWLKLFNGDIECRMLVYRN